MAIDQEELKRFQTDASNRRQAESAKTNLNNFKNTWKLNTEEKMKKKSFIWLLVVILIGFVIFKFLYNDDFKNATNAYNNEKFEEAALYYKKACEKGNTDACFNLGQMYDYGEGVEENNIKAAELFTIACDGNDFQGCFNLGMMYAKGDGTNQNKHKAVELFDKACKGSEGNGCFNLAYAYNKGIGVKQNQFKAMKLYGKACELGIEEGCGNYNYMSNQNF